MKRRRSSGNNFATKTNTNLPLIIEEDVKENDRSIDQSDKEPGNRFFMTRALCVIIREFLR